MIKFGTDGWRAVVGQDFNLENVRVVAQAIADYLIDMELSPKGIVIGHDTRQLGREAALACQEVLIANGIDVYLCQGVVPTPVVSYAVVQCQAGGGIMITASHNPANWNGIKFKAKYGGSGLPTIINEIEQRLGENSVQRVPAQGRVGKVIAIQPKIAYLDKLKQLVDIDLIKRAGIKVIVDPMHGAAAGYIADLLVGGNTVVEEIRYLVDDTFGGVNPEPIKPNLVALVDAVAQTGAHVGLATDGDGDRIGAVSEAGEVISAQYLYALLLQHLVDDKGWSGGVVKTFSTTRLIDQLARRYQIPVHETPIGFKYICELMLKEDILLGGEESGGIGFKHHLPERDGVLSGLFLLEMMAQRKLALGELIDQLMESKGRYCYDRIDLHLPAEQKDAMVRNLREQPPAEFAGAKVNQVLTLDGYKLLLEDGSWILFRASGTEPVVRVYAEAASDERVQELLNAGEALAKL